MRIYASCKSKLCYKQFLLTLILNSSDRFNKKKQTTQYTKDACKVSVRATFSRRKRGERYAPQPSIAIPKSPINSQIETQAYGVSEKADVA